MSSPPPPPSSQAPRPRDLLGVRSLLAERDFVRIWVTGALGWTVRWLEVLSIALYALAETGSALVVALMLFVRVAPTTLLAGPFGAVADRFDRRRLLCIGLALLCLNSLVLGALAAVGVLTLWHIAIGAFLNGCVWSGEHSVRRTLLAEIVGLERLGRATSLDSATNQATRMIGPLIGGLLFGLLGLQGAYFIGAILFAIAFFNVARLDTEVRIATGPAIGLLSSIREGLSHVRANRPVAATLAVTIIMNLFGFPYFSMIPVIGERVLDLSAAGIGLLMSLDGLGATLGSVALAIFIRPRLYLPVYLAGAFLLMATIVGFGGSPWLELSAPILFLGGIGFAGFGAMQSAILLSRTPEALRARVMGLLAVCIGTGPIGLLHIGLLAEWLGASAAVTISAFEGLLALGVASWYWPELRRCGGS